MKEQVTERVHHVERYSNYWKGTLLIANKNETTFKSLSLHGLFQQTNHFTVKDGDNV